MGLKIHSFKSAILHLFISEVCQQATSESPATSTETGYTTGTGPNIFNAILKVTIIQSLPGDIEKRS